MSRLRYADLLRTNTEPPLYLVCVRSHEQGAFAVGESCPSNWLGVEETSFRGVQDNHDALSFVRTAELPDDALEDGGETCDPNYQWGELFPEMLS